MIIHIKKLYKRKKTKEEKGKENVCYQRIKLYCFLLKGIIKKNSFMNVKTIHV